MCSLAMRRARDWWRRPISGTRSTTAKWSGTDPHWPNLPFLCWGEAVSYNAGERLPVSFPLPQLDLLSLRYCLLMEDYEGWEDRGNFPRFQSLIQMTPLKGRSCWQQPAADGLCLTVPELISVSSSELPGWIMPGMEEASLNEVNQPVNPL